MRRLALLVGLALVGASFAQFKLPTKPPIPNINIGGLKNVLFKEEPPLSSSLGDTINGLKYLDAFEPGAYQALTAEMRNAKGAWQLKPGYYEVDIHTFCGRAYSYGPSRGMGYLEAPWKGQRAKLLQNLMRKYSLQSRVSQRDTQLLVWAIIARCKPSDMQGETKAAAVALLSPQEIASMETGALDFLEDKVMGELMGPVDKALRPLYEAENKMRQTFYQANQPFEQLERLAMREPEGEVPTQIPRGRWIYHPNGYVMRFLPSGYSRTKLQVVVPHNVSITRDERGRITRMEGPAGYISEVEYNDELMPEADPNGSKTRMAFPFKLVRLIGPDKNNPGQTITEEFRNTGWCYTEKPKKATLLYALMGRGGQSNWFTRWRERAERLNEMREQAEEAQRQAERMDRIWRGDANSDDFMDRSHYRDGLEAATTGSTGDRVGWIAEHHARQNEALIWATNLIDSLPGGGPEVDPTGGVIMPANPGSQRLLGSSNSF